MKRLTLLGSLIEQVIQRIYSHTPSECWLWLSTLIAGSSLLIAAALVLRAYLDQRQSARLTRRILDY